MREYRLDPRTKLVIVLLLSSVAIIYSDILFLLLIFVTSIVLAKALGADLVQVFYRFKKIIGVIFAIAIVQSIFTREGLALISIGDLAIVTDYGIIKSLEFLLRMGIIVGASAIISTSSTRDIIQALIQLKIPYEIAFMVSIAIRFLPVFREEFTDMITAIQLRGIDLKKIKFGHKLRVYNYILVPIVINSLLKAKQLSAAMEMRGFRAYPERTSIRNLRMDIIDYIFIIVSIAVSLIIVLNFK